MTGKTSYANLPTAACFELAEQITKESDNLWRIANDIAKEKSYGYAITTMISSLEELIKAVVLTIDGCGFEFRRIRGFDTFFRDHGLRQFTVFIMFGYGVFGDELKKYLPPLRENPSLFKDFLAKVISH